MKEDKDEMVIRIVLRAIKGVRVTENWITFVYKPKSRCKKWRW